MSSRRSHIVSHTQSHTHSISLPISSIPSQVSYWENRWAVASLHWKEFLLHQYRISLVCHDVTRTLLRLLGAAGCGRTSRQIIQFMRGKDLITQLNQHLFQQDWDISGCPDASILLLHGLQTIGRDPNPAPHHIVSGSYFYC